MTRLKSCKLVLLSVVTLTLDGVMYVECKNETDKNVSLSNGAEPLHFLFDVFVLSLPAAQVTYLLHLRSSYKKVYIGTYIQIRNI